LRATASDVAYYIDGTGSDATRFRREHPITDADVEIANKAHEWAKGLSDLSNDYLYNIHTIANMDALESRHYGFAASIVSSYLREVERENLYRARREASESSQWIGTVGQRLDFEAVCVSIRSHEGNFGITYICKFVSNGRDQITWFSSNEPTFDENMIINFKGTVKQHDEYQGIKQTIVTRCKVIRTRNQ
jgi:hypothetical protein